MIRRSTQNLIRNGGFSTDLQNDYAGWQAFPATARPSRIATTSFNEIGLPHASAALELSAQTCPLIRQIVTLPEGETDRWVLRITARARSEGGCTLAILGQDASGQVSRLHEAVFAVSPDWQRCRMEFAHAPSASCIVEIQAASGSAIEVTDVRLVGLRREAETFAIRFDTRGTILLPSTRLRALMIEDYLDLLGWPTRVNTGNGHDLLICQKVTHWAGLLAARLRGARVIYDLDDNELAGRVLRAIRVGLFARMVDGVTSGGDYLNARLSRPDAPAYLLDNPVDLLDTGIVHTTQVWNGRIVWFGMRENAWALDALSLRDKIVRITRGGDIPYDLRTIDQELVGHDLAVLPLTLTEHTRAKNANRLVKCVGLGLPFLASDTPEHRRALARLGLSDRVLVRDGEDWSARIGDVRDNYPAFKAEISAARTAAFAAYGIEAIVDGWLEYCEGVMGRKAR